MVRRKRLRENQALENQDNETDSWDSIDHVHLSAETCPIGSTEEENPRQVTKKEKRRRVRRNLLENSRKDLFFIHDRQPGYSSLKSVLIQALVSKDTTLLDSVLNVVDLLVIRRTISELPSVHIEDFIHQTISRCYESPLRIRMLGPWLRELLRQHITFCSSVPNIRKSFAGLYKQVTARLRNHYSGIKLQGELDTLAYLGHRRIEESRIVHDTLASQKPLLTVRESPSTVGRLETISLAVQTKSDESSTWA